MTELNLDARRGFWFWMAKEPISETEAESAGFDATAPGEGRDPVVSEMKERDVRTFIEAWLQRNARVLEDVVRQEGSKPHTRYGAALARVLAYLSTNRRPDA